MDLNVYFKSVLEQDTSSIVLCNLQHEIIYMNPAAARNYAKRGGKALVGRSLMGCHNEDSCRKIERVIEWFKRSRENNIVFTFHNPAQNKDVYMVALRDDSGELIGYYEKHEYRTPETRERYCLE